jgi:tetratricopeptide (TPR) repeat protein
MTRSSARASRRARHGARLAALVGALVGLGLAGVARAQSGADKAMAEQLFEAGRALVKQGKHAEACPKFEASFALDPALGTQLNLARCYERVGKLASAWGHYREAAGRARQAGQPQRERAARGFAAALEPALPRLVIRLTAGGDVPGLEVARDGRAVSPALFDTEVYVDPGPHEITATASGYERFAVTVSAREREQVVVAIPVLTPLAAGAGPAPPAAGPAAGAVDAPARRAGGRGRRLLGLGLGSGGIALLAGSAGFALAANAAWDEAFDSGACARDALVCTPAGQDLTDRARARGLVADVLAGAGVALAVTGAVLYLTAPSGDDAPAAGGAAGVRPVLGPGAVGVAVTGSF